MTAGPLQGDLLYTGPPLWHMACGRTAHTGQPLNQNATTLMNPQTRLVPDIERKAERQVVTPRVVQLIVADALMYQ